jgi:ferritin-like metal-binding protein YciE
MLIIYLNLINEHGHETLINSLQGIFEIFAQDLKPYVKDILDGLCKVTIKIMEKQKQNEDEEDESTFSVITSLETISQLLEVDIS